MTWRKASVTRSTEDTDGDGTLSDAEAKWPGWKDVPQLWRDVATKDGKVYVVPTPGFARATAAAPRALAVKTADKPE